MKRNLVSGILLIFSHCCFGSYEPHSIPNPDSKEGAIACNRMGVEKSSICDPKNYLDTETKDVIEGYINKLQDFSQVGVLIIDDMSPSFIKSRSIETSAKDFAMQVHNAWGIGDKVTNNGVLIFISVEDRAVFISTGRGVSHKLTLSLLDDIIDNMKPYLREKMYGKSIESCVAEISMILSGKVSSFKMSKYNNNDTIKSFLFFGISIIVMAWLGIYSYLELRKTERLERGKSVLEKFVKDVTASSQNPKYMSQTCPICLEDFSTSPHLDSVDDTQEKKYDEKVLNSTETDWILSNENKNLNPNESSTRNNDNPKKPMSLQCGHVFCYSCVLQHLKQSQQHRKCPICRENIDGTKSPQVHPHSVHRNTGANYGTTTRCVDTLDSDISPSETSNSREGMRTQRSTMVQVIDWLQFHYRLNRIRHLYPDVIDASSYSALNHALQQQNVPDLIRHSEMRSVAVQRIITDYQVRQVAAQEGKSGSRSSFGGGISFEGHGGRW